MKRRKISVFRNILLATLILGLLIFPPVSLARDAEPKLYCLEANPATVSIGPQPWDSPLVLSVKAKGPGGGISKIAVNLADLLEAKYYDPGSDTIKDAGMGILMMRVYEIEGSEAYLVLVGSRYELNEYRKAITHERVRGTAVATDKWQIELPNVGRAIANFGLGVVATNMFNQQSTAAISLKVVDDSTAPEVSASAKYLVNSPATRIGDKVTIAARVVDDLCGVHSVRLVENEAKPVFGESPNLALARQIDSDVWEVQNTVARNVMPGVYPVQVAAVDRAGNEAIKTVGVTVAEEIASLQIELNEGWNLISVPKALENPAVKEVFAELPVETVRTMIAGRWLDVSEIAPGLGYLVKASSDTTLVVNFGNYDFSAIPLTINLGQGWNLIGYASQSLNPVMPLTFYLGDSLNSEWSIVYNAEGDQARPQSTSPYIWANDGFPTITGEPYSADTSDNLPAVELGKGYWIYLSGDGILMP